MHAASIITIVLSAIVLSLVDTGFVQEVICVVVADLFLQGLKQLRAARVPNDEDGGGGARA